MRINVASGKYTFVKTVSGDIDIDTAGGEWMSDLKGSRAIVAMMCELDAARVVLVAVRDILNPKHEGDVDDILRELRESLKQHDALVDDHEQPSEWAK